MEFTLPAELAALKDKVDAFVRNDIVPFEKDTRWTSHGPTDELRGDLNAKAKAAGLLAIHSPKAYGGQGLSHFEKAI
ncbi:MAG TPA: acyl-CoA dehydrogenase family protein, partial [Hyphomicrobiaceae bacterium]|nr:acyl-CoA dehydrogenase family protein [Hyphomicrobiaceae bacterium]